MAKLAIFRPLAIRKIHECLLPGTVFSIDCRKSYTFLNNESYKTCDCNSLCDLILNLMKNTSKQLSGFIWIINNSIGKSITWTFNTIGSSFDPYITTFATADCSRIAITVLVILSDDSSSRQSKKVKWINGQRKL